MVHYKDQLVGYVPGRRAADRERAFFSMSDAVARRLILKTAGNFLFDAFTKGSRRHV
jgi:hypothetical protein